MTQVMKKRKVNKNNPENNLRVKWQKGLKSFGKNLKDGISKQAMRLFRL